jgi:cytochrome P450
VCLLIDAGSETTATTLSGCLFLLAASPQCLKKLTTLLRDTFPAAEQMDICGLARLPYLTQVIKELMRIYPSIPATLPRVTPESGVQSKSLRN